MACSEEPPSYDQWSDYLGDPSRSHFTSLDQIKAENLDQLDIAWTYESPDTGQMQMNPIIVNDVLYGVTAGLRAFALDAESGEEIWVYGDKEKAWHSTSRGVSYWADGSDQRILFTRGDQLIALDASSGKPISTFGVDGSLDLHLGLPEIAQDKFIISNTPGAIFGDLIIMPVRLSEGADAAPGDIRAFNVRDGSLAWTFHVIPYPGEEGYDTWEKKDAYKNTEGIGAGNNWSGITVDEETGILYIPTGSFAPDFYGGHRKGTNLYSNCLLALDGRSGELLWHQQLTHHDIWDRDLPAPPNLLSIEKDGRHIDVVAQISKQGYVYVFDRLTGEPVFEILEVEVPESNLESAWPTQPIPSLPPPFARLSSEITEDDVSPFAPNREELSKQLSTAKRSFYSPPDTTPTLLLPGYDGGAEWGGAGIDPHNGIMYINSNEMPWMLQLEKTKRAPTSPVAKGAFLYESACASCHGKEMEGNAQSGYPSLKDVEGNLDRSEILSVISQGRGMMPGFTGWPSEDKEAVTDYILGLEDQMVEVKKGVNDRYDIPYKHTGYHKFLDANGLPAISPPWGTLNAIDLNTGRIIWKQAFGEVDSLVNLGHPATGTENYGGPIITENGLLIIAATKDGKARIYDRLTGDLLWSERLPAASFATPATYMSNGRQYIVFACGGEKLNTKVGHQLIAYAVKQNE